MTDAAKDLLLQGAAQLGLELSPQQISQFTLLSTELQKWGRKINLTAIRGEADIILKHFIDSLTLLKVLEGRGALLDLGSGAGFPSLPLKIVCPDLQVVSVDAVEKKILFQRHAARLLDLTGFEAVHARGEALAAIHAVSFDHIVSRAFSDIPGFVAMALPLVKPDGVILAMKGKGGRMEADEAEASLAAIGTAITEIVEFPLPVTGDARSIIVIQRKRP